MNIIIPSLGGLGLFIYGMNLMGDALERAAGSRLRKILSFLTRNKLMGILMGIIVTVIIQSSSATTVMVVGFVNAGLMTLTQAFSVILGANIGTTITAQIIAFNLTGIAPVSIAIGVAVNVLASNKKIKDFSEILIGFGLLFLGMDLMGAGLKPLGESAFFQNLLLRFTNPWLALLAGVLLTTVVQSSSASIGILQAFVLQGLIGIDLAFPILLGQNIGTTTTAMLSSIGTNNNAKRTALLHFFIKVIGSIIFMLFLRGFVVNKVVSMTPNNVARQVANAHTIFNLTNTIVMLPLSNIMIKLVTAIIPYEEKEKEQVAHFLDYRMIATPAVATQQVFSEINRVFDISADNLKLVQRLIKEKEYDLKEEIIENEKVINKLSDEITDFVVRLNRESISPEQSNLNTLFIFVINDLERIGDHIINICDTGDLMKENGAEFSGEALEELKQIFESTFSNVKYAQKAIETFDYESAKKVLEIEQGINQLESILKINHIKRMENQMCDTLSGVNFLDIISNLERISDHCQNLAEYVIDNPGIITRKDTVSLDSKGKVEQF